MGVIKARITAAIDDEFYFLRRLEEAEELFKERWLTLPVPLGNAREVATPPTWASSGRQNRRTVVAKRPASASSLSKRPATVVAAAVKKKPAGTAAATRRHGASEGSRAKQSH